MKATGIIRRIDDLGRIVIPKEIRRTLRVREGDPMEIFVGDGELMLKKYSELGTLSDFAKQVCSSVHKASFDRKVVITDGDYIVASAGVRLASCKPCISEELLSAISSRKIFRDEENTLPLMADDSELEVSFAAPIVMEGDVIGCIAFLDSSEYTIDDADIKIALAFAHLLGTIHD